MIVSIFTKLLRCLTTNVQDRRKKGHLWLSRRKPDQNPCFNFYVIEKVESNDENSCFSNLNNGGFSGLIWVSSEKATDNQERLICKIIVSVQFTLDNNNAIR